MGPFLVSTGNYRTEGCSEGNVSDKGVVNALLELFKRSTTDAVLSQLRSSAPRPRDPTGRHRDAPDGALDGTNGS